MELREHIPAIVEYIESKSKYLQTSERMFEVLEGDFKSKVIEALRQQITSDSAFNSAVNRIPAINTYLRISEKLSQIYTSEVKRTAMVDGKQNEQAQEVIDWYVKELGVNDRFHDIDKFGNATNYGATEPYINKYGQPKLRVIPPHQMLVYSTDAIDPNIPDVFIKPMGKRKVLDQEEKIYWLYTDDEFVIINDKGDVISQEDEENSYGVIPQTYFNESNYKLMPFQPIDMLDIAILISLLYTDLNEATKWMAYSMIYAIDVDSTNFERNPSVIIDIKSDSPDSKPEIGTIEPKVDITNVIELIRAQFNDWLDSKGLKSKGGQAQVNQAVSGISLMIQEIDTTQMAKKRMVKFENFERDFWSRMISIHNVWVENGTVEMPALPYDLEVVTEFDIPKPVEEEDARLDRAIKAKDKGLATTKDALEIWKPKMDEPELEAKSIELDQLNSVVIEEIDGEELDKNQD